MKRLELDTSLREEHDDEIQGQKAREKTEEEREALRRIGLDPDKEGFEDVSDILLLSDVVT
jgi:hypothetical protein